MNQVLFVYAWPLDKYGPLRNRQFFSLNKVLSLIDKQNYILTGGVMFEEQNQPLKIVDKQGIFFEKSIENISA